MPVSQGPLLADTSPRLLVTAFLAFMSALNPLSVWSQGHGSADTVQPQLPTPAEFVGHDTGALPTRPDLAGQYVELIAARSPRVHARVIGRTHQQRPVHLVSVSSPRHITAIESDGEANERLTVWLMFAVHGDEVSTVDAALLTLYELAASNDPRIERMLEDTLIQIVPMVNPDGYARAASWIIAHASAVDVDDPQHAEHTLGWPRGRFNHYGFDLNRQWLAATQPEIQALLREYRRSRPHLVGDFHEMLIQWPYYFSPGVPSQNNPWLSPHTLALQQQFGRHVAEVLDQRGDLYFSGEFFDEMSPAMGSNYPNLTGSVGLLLENRGFAGREIATAAGVETLRSRILRHRDVAMGLVSAAHRDADALRRHRREFIEETSRMAQRAGDQGFVASAPGDPARLDKLRKLLLLHGLEVYRPRTPESGEPSLFVPLNQPGYRLVRNIFEPLRQFEDTVFYDSPAWTLPLALNLEVTLARLPVAQRLPSDTSTRSAQFSADPDAHSYVFDWRNYHAPRALARLLRAGGQARLVTEPTLLATSAGQREFPAGVVVVPTAEGQPLERQTLHRVLQTLAQDEGIEILATASARPDAGAYLGSRLSSVARLPRLVLLRGEALNHVEGGELWHLLDQQAGVAVSLRDVRDFAALDLAGYTHVLMPDGDYAGFPGAERARLADWISRGGTLIAVRRAALWAIEHGLLSASNHSEPDSEQLPGPAMPQRTDYADKESAEAQQRVSGAILAADIDITHPLGSGLTGRRLPMHTSSARPMPRAGGAFSMVAQYSDEPPLAGYIAEGLLEGLAGSPAMIAERQGQGSVILFAENPDFRGYWYGTHRLLFNALYLSRSFLAPGRRFAE
ncbi:MAG: hypothetical protein JJU27_09765 [Gammaproteobacteria bacterium]|nr:hypothetical protein [Gammaproteobacteria bacterium]